MIRRVCDDIIDNYVDVSADCGDPTASRRRTVPLRVNDPRRSSSSTTHNASLLLRRASAAPRVLAQRLLVTSAATAKTKLHGIRRFTEVQQRQRVGPGRLLRPTDACGIPCTSFFGDVCPFVAPGSTCNEATDQCEF